MFTDVPFNAADYQVRDVGAWTVAEQNVEYYRYAAADGVATVAIYIEQGSTITANGANALPAILSIALPDGVVAAGYAQQQLHYTVDENYAAFPNDAVMFVESGDQYETCVQIRRIGGTFPAGSNLAFWGTLTFPIQTA